MLTSFLRLFDNKMQHATHCGSWYPSGSRLTQLLEKELTSAKVDTSISGKVKAVIAPHAGYTYCAKTAAHAFVTVDPSLYERVVILGPSHQYYSDACTIVDATQIETPFGNIDIDTVGANKLLKDHPKFFQKLDIRNAENEHSLEMMLPFLKYIFKDKKFTVIPIMVGQLSESALAGTTEALKEIINDEKTFLCVSSDFTHWGRRFRYTYLPESSEPIWKRISMIDHKAMEMISTCDVEKFRNYIKESKATICGRTPISIAMGAINKPYRVDWPHYSQSSHAENMEDSSVSYAAGVIRLI
jgi:AmmeMemoRadiSam system protein B